MNFDDKPKPPKPPPPPRPTPHPVDPRRPRDEPLTALARVNNYRQTGRTMLTPRQRRRAEHKAHHAMRRRAA